MDTIPSGAAPRIAIATTDESVQLAAQEILASVFHTTLLGSGTEIMPLLDEVSLEAIILDLETAHVSDPEVLRLIRKLRHQDETLVLLGFTRSHNKAARSQFEQAGISHCFVAPVDFEEVQKVLQRALEERAAEIENRRLREEARNRNSFCQLIGGSDSMRLVYDSISRLAESSVNVLIRGESGTGKELVAQAIVASGPRRAKPFVSVNCAALPESLIEAELFGHEKGSFTDAHEARAGHIEAAHGGTLFLDEIGTLGLGLQSKLLRVLEQHVIQRIGSRSGKKIDFRLIAATNEDLEEAVRVGRFREDLYYRINVVPIVLPPLRERPGDLAILLDHFLRMYCAANSLPLKRLDSDALEILEEYHWPGNVRELENLVQRLVIMGSGAVITAKHLPQQILYTSTAKQEALLIPEEGISFDQEIARIELAYLQAALRRTGGKKVAAAALLQINAQKMKYLCRKYGLKG
ncbi:MAG TPA: sigma-54 dependent transcriptional regulator [Terriglobales bacterium]|nr:sigma-54 dependent transcriptional regulator [Terriglobales bacterium]